MTEKPGSEPAYPIVATNFINNGLETNLIPGYLTRRQHAAIQLRVPESGEPWLDDMIRRARRVDFVKAAMQGIMANPEGWDKTENITKASVNIADACLKLEAETREADNGNL